MRKRVHGHTQLFTFEGVGIAICRNILDAARPHISLDAHSRVLNFGCGCGRVLVYLIDAVRCDTRQRHRQRGDRVCGDNLADFGNFIHNDPLPPLPMADATFDFVYSVSVFTHLPERMQFRWLEELERITKPGGFLLLTTRGTQSVPLNWLQHLRFRLTGFVYVAGGKTPGLPDFYRNAFHAESYIRDRWSKFVKIVQSKARGINGDQDWTLCQKRF